MAASTASLRCVAQGGGLHFGRPKQSGSQQSRQAPQLPSKRLPSVALPAFLRGLGLAAPSQQTGAGGQQQQAQQQQQQQQQPGAAQPPQPCPTQCPDTARSEARRLVDQKYNLLLVTFAGLLLLACCPLGLLVSVALVVADLLSQLVLNLLSGVPIDASSSFLLGLAVGATGSIRRIVRGWRAARRQQARHGSSDGGGAAPVGA